MPWKRETNPYKVWLSEVILQQTRVDQGLKYYESFVKAFPDIDSLAKAPDQEIFKLWEGLGYYARCRNLIETARRIAGQLSGEFPTCYEEIIKLKGIGSYTAAAIASFAFNEPRAVVDGNVFRLLSRLFGIDKAIDTAEGKRFFDELAEQLLNKKQPAIYNQAIMDFGAVVCKPVPECTQCPFNRYCVALHNENISSLPVKSKKVTIKKRWFYYALFDHNGRFAIRQRTEKDIWPNLFEFLLIESEKELDQSAIVRQLKEKSGIMRDGIKVKSISPVFRQQLSHQLIEGRFAELRITHKPTRMVGMTWVKKAEMKNYAFPKFITQYLEKRTDVR